MSHHNKELYPEHNTDEIRAELALHGLPIDKPSQIADCFRFGFIAGQNGASKESLLSQLSRYAEDFGFASNADDVEKMIVVLKGYHD